MHDPCESLLAHNLLLLNQFELPSVTTVQILGCVHGLMGNCSREFGSLLPC